MAVVEDFLLAVVVEGGQDGVEVDFVGKGGEAFLELVFGAAGLDFVYELVIVVGC